MPAYIVILVITDEKKAWTESTKNGLISLCELFFYVTHMFFFYLCAFINDILTSKISTEFITHLP